MQKVARAVVRQGLLFTLLASLLSTTSLAEAAKKDDKKGADKKDADKKDADKKDADKKDADKKGADKKDAEEKDAEEEASADATKVVLGAFEGPKSDGAREWAVTGLIADPGIELVGDDTTAGIKQGASEEEMLAAAMAAGASAVVVGRVSLQKKVGWGLTLWVYNGADGKLIQKVAIRGGVLPGLRRKIEGSIGKTLAAPLEKAAPPPGMEGAEAVEEEEVEEETEPAELPPPTEQEFPPEDEVLEAKAVQGASPLDLRIGFRFYKRSFKYTDTLHDYDPNQPYLLDHETPAGSPMFIFSGNIYPGAFFSTEWYANIGLTVGYEQGFLTKTAMPDPVSMQTLDLNQSHTELYGGVRYRIKFGEHEVAPFLSFGKHSFTIENDRYPYPVSTGASREPCVPYQGTTVCYEDALPDVNYSYVDLGVNPRLVFDKVSLGAHAAYRIVNDAGGLQKSAPRAYDTWFPNAEGHGVSFGINGGYAVTPVYEVLVGLDYTRYGFAFHVPPASQLPLPPARIAGGATDTYVSGWVGVGIRLAGVEIMQDPGAPTNEVEDPENEDVEELDF